MTVSWYRDNSLEECGLELFFSTDFEILGKVEHHELKPGGDDIQVTDENKHDYIRSATFGRRLKIHQNTTNS